MTLPAHGTTSSILGAKKPDPSKGVRHIATYACYHYIILGFYCKPIFVPPGSTFVSPLLSATPELGVTMFRIVG